jgi:hypothetical protein
MYICIWSDFQFCYDWLRLWGLTLLSFNNHLVMSLPPVLLYVKTGKSGVNHWTSVGQEVYGYEVSLKLIMID